MHTLAPPLPRREERPEPARIEMKLRGIAQLFHTMDPSPFLERELDEDAERYIVSWARELPPNAPLRVVIHLSGPDPAPEAADVEAAVQNHFTARIESLRHDFRELLRRGRTTLAIGLGFLLACTTGAELLGPSPALFIARIAQESLIIAGWVAMWRPLELCLYEWWPLVRTRRIYERLRASEVELLRAA